MNDREQAALLTLCLISTFANDNRDEHERAHIRRVAETLSIGVNLNLALVYQDVLLKRCELQDVVNAIERPELRQLAYEMAVCICDADWVHTDAEHAFLERLRLALRLDVRAARSFERIAGTISNASLQPEAARGFSTPAHSADSVALDRSILDYAIFNGALELLPQSLAALAVIPIQMKMVYRIGKAYGYEFDRGQIKDFLSMLEIGLAGQCLEQFGLKLANGLWSKLGADTTTLQNRSSADSGVSFAATYALGHATKQYYSSDRTLQLEKLRETFEALMTEGRAIQRQYTADIDNKAHAIEVNDLVTLVKQR